MNVKKAVNRSAKLAQTLQVTWLVVNEVQCECFELITERRHYSLQRMSYLCELLFCEVSCIFQHRVWYCVLSLHVRVLCMYSTFRHHPHP